MMIQLRFATYRDVPEILGLIKELALYEKLSTEVVATQQQLEDTLFGERPYAEVLIAEVDGAIAGFALFFHSYSTFLAQPGIYLEDLYVRPPFRKVGVGRSLMQKLAWITLKRRCGRLEWAVLDWNTSAIEFYNKLGAQPLSDWTTFRVTKDALVSLAEKE
jgi:GNAT superfamily N-acetyltransferase